MWGSALIEDEFVIKADHSYQEEVVEAIRKTYRFAPNGDGWFEAKMNTAREVRRIARSVRRGTFATTQPLWQSILARLAVTAAVPRTSAHSVQRVNTALIRAKVRSQRTIRVQSVRRARIAM